MKHMFPSPHKMHTYTVLLQLELNTVSI